jgi:hypothetical protein
MAYDDHAELDVDELARLIAIMMASDTRHAPILRGVRAPTRPEREQHRADFAKWVAARLLDGGVKVLKAPYRHTNYYPSAAAGTPPQRFAHLAVNGRKPTPPQLAN